MAVVMIATFTHFNATKTEAKESTNYVIKVNLGTNCTTIYNKEGKAIKAMICSPSSETPTGTFYVPVKYRWHEMIGNCYARSIVQELHRRYCSILYGITETEISHQCLYLHIT